MPLTVVEIGRDQPSKKTTDQDETSTEAFLHGGGAAISPLEYALFLQSILEFQPTVVAFENILKWRERDKDQEQVFLDQAMRVPKLFVRRGIDQDAGSGSGAGPKSRGFTQVTGNRGQLVGIYRCWTPA